MRVQLFEVGEHVVGHVAALVLPPRHQLLDLHRALIAGRAENDMTQPLAVREDRGFFLKLHASERGEEYLRFCCAQQENKKQNRW